MHLETKRSISLILRGHYLYEFRIMPTLSCYVNHKEYSESHLNHISNQNIVSMKFDGNRQSDPSQVNGSFFPIGNVMNTVTDVGKQRLKINDKLHAIFIL